MADDPVLVMRIDGEQVDSACIANAKSVGSQQGTVRIAGIIDQALHVMADLDGREVVDGVGPGVVTVQQRRARLQGVAAQRPFERLVNQRLLELRLPVPGARVVVDREGILERGG